MLLCMSDPLALFPFAIAAGGGHVDGLDVTRLIAAGVTLLQRSAPAVRALAGRRSAILLPPGPAFLTALAASDGRGAVLLSAESNPAEIAAQIEAANVGAVFTDDAAAARLPIHMPAILLDGVPAAARVLIGGSAREIDLGSHFGLPLEGSRDADGSVDECLVEFDVGQTSTFTSWTHRTLLNATRIAARDLGVTPMHDLSVVGPWSDVRTLIATGAAPLYHGARISTRG